MKTLLWDILFIFLFMFMGLVNQTHLATYEYFFLTGISYVLSLVSHDLRTSDTSFYFTYFYQNLL